MDKLTRKELKSDKFALEVQHSVEFVSHHRQQMILWAAPAVAVVLIVIGIFYYRTYQHNARQEAAASRHANSKQLGWSFAIRIRCVVSHSGGSLYRRYKSLDRSGG